MTDKVNQFEKTQSEEQIEEKIFEKDMHAWVERRIELIRERIQRTGEPMNETEEKYETELKNLTSEELFRVYQNNFWMSLKFAFQYLDDNGAAKPEYASSELINALHLQEVHRIILDLGYDPRIMQHFGESSRKLTNEEWEIVKKVFLEMKKRGYNDRDLRG